MALHVDASKPGSTRSTIPAYPIVSDDESVNIVANPDGGKVALGAE